MTSDKEQFFQLQSFAVVGSSDLKPFPKITYRNLRGLGRKVFPVDMGGSRTVEGDEAFRLLTDLPETVDGVIIEVPRHKVMEVVQQADQLGIKDVWLHQGCESPSVLQFCQEKGLRARSGGCGVMYTQEGFSYHSIHKFIVKILGKY